MSLIRSLGSITYQGGCFVSSQLTKQDTELEIRKSSDLQNGNGFFTKGSL